jgi:hypothetical protein
MEMANKKETAIYRKVVAAKTPVAIKKVLGNPDIVYYSPENYPLPAPEFEIRKKEMVFKPSEVFCYNNAFKNYRIEIFLKDNNISNIFFIPVKRVAAPKKPKKAKPKRKKVKKSPPKRKPKLKTKKKVKKKTRAAVKPKSKKTKPKSKKAKPKPRKKKKKG